MAEGQQDLVEFTYSITDDQGEVSTANVSITLNGLNDAPFAFDDNFVTDEDTGISGDLFAENGDKADSDPDNGATFNLSAINGAAPAFDTPFELPDDGGTLVVRADGTFDFTPNAAANALAEGQQDLVEFTYSITDDVGAVSTANVSITLNGLNDPPIAFDDDFITDEDTGVSGDFFADNGNGADFDADDGATFTLSAINGEAPAFDTPFELPDDGGTLVVRADGTFDYTPNAAANALAEGQQDLVAFTYSITDDVGAVSTANVSITLDGLNDAPVALTDRFEISQDDDLSGDLFADNEFGADFDVDAGDAFTVTAINGVADLVGQPVVLDGGGSVIVNPDGSFDFANNGGYVDLAEGETADLAFIYTITDGNGATSTTTVDLTIQGVNDAPVAIADAFEFSEEEIQGQFNVLADNGEGADLDPENDPVIVATANGQAVPQDGLNFFTDGGLEISITPDGDFEISDPDNVFDFLDEGQTAADVFSYSISDPQGLTSASTVDLTITGVNDAPVANDDQVIVAADQTVLFDPIQGVGAAADGQDFDPEGGPLALVTINGDAVAAGDVVSLLSGANVAVNADGTLEYLPSGAFDGLEAGQTGQDSFAYEIEDEGGLRSEAEVFVEIQPFAIPPVANDDQIAASEDAAVIADLFADNGDGADQNFAAGDLLLTGINGASVANGASVTLASGAILLIDETGQVQYDPNGAFEALNTGQTATDSFLYTITDSSGFQDEAEVTVSVSGANDAPQALDDRFTTDERTLLAANLFDNNGDGFDFDVDSSFTITAINGDNTLVGQQIDLPSGALVTVDENGDLNFDPNGAFDLLIDGQDAFEELTYTITDAEGASADASFTVQITGITDVILGSDGDDVIRGTEFADDIDGRGGNDLITGLAGADSIKGSQGVDIIRGGSDGDLLQGGAGADRLFGEGGNDRVEGGGGADRLLGLAGSDTVIGGAGDDTVSGGGGDDLVIGGIGDDRLRGGRDADTLIAGDGRDLLQGGTGNDILQGEDGNDNLTGAGGRDTLSGGDGIDRLFGRRGSDELTGGEGSDRFIFNLGDGSDTITDFEQGVDLIRIGTGAETFDDLSITQVGDDALITFGNVRILALDEDADDFTNNDFLL